jgi:two-component system, chemotaxis family, response regulator Rcp1
MQHSFAGKPIEILLVEDNPGDVRLTVEALKDAKVLNHLTIARDGVEALALLRRQRPHDNAARPDLILLDLNLPLKDGREVLAEIKSDDGLKRIPVVILTTSRAEEDILKIYNLHANCYITKPVDLEQFVTVVKSIEDFWFTVVKLPIG